MGDQIPPDTSSHQKRNNPSTMILIEALGFDRESTEGAVLVARAAQVAFIGFGGGRQVLLFVLLVRFVHVLIMVVTLPTNDAQ